MKKLLTVVVATAAVAAPLALSVPAAEAAGNPACITRAEFKKIKQGMTNAQVKRVVGSAGQVSVKSGSFVIRTHKTCAPWHVSNVSYQGGRVSGKLYI